MNPLRLTASGSTFIVQDSHPRPQQTGKLATIPAEILELIAENIDGPANRDIKALALSSARLFSILRPVYYKSGHHKNFATALFQADVPRLERHHETTPFPTDDVWFTHPTLCRCQDATQMHVRHRPIDIFLWGLINEVSKPRRRAQTISWLFSKGYQVNNWFEHAYDGTMTNMMPEVLVNLLQRDIAQDKANTVCKIIRFLSNQGISIPLWVRPDRAPAWYRETREVDQFIPDFHISGLHVNAYHLTTMEIAMRSHCPPALLEVLLQEYARRGCLFTSLELDTKAPPAALKDLYNAQIPLADTSLPWFFETPFENIIAGLYANLMESTGWEESYQGETVDIWARKTKLLMRFGALDEHEINLFLRVRRALKKIAELPYIPKSTSTNPSPATRQTEQDRWVILCDSVKRNFTKPELQSTLETWAEPENPGKTRRPHRFVFSADWNPWMNFYMSRKKRDRWVKFSENCLGTFNDFMVFQSDLITDTEWYDLVSFSDSNALPLWHEVQYSIWANGLELIMAES
ncbi:hypothetical protein F53441_8109 [Fusarium austroafricanum]|uniref:Uncharacterized protein n=1 Tax=Fusarium austroafricanum TaxID=2364996 RepID=A0A8H4KF67_9HYPO|nr:hypothetical protein F53441_8109 [Fusarium austroafricanum]